MAPLKDYDKDYPMEESSRLRASNSPWMTAVKGLFLFLGSLRLAVLLIVVLAVVLAWATIVESTKGREYAQWYVYHSRWFSALLGILALNIFAATVNRFPWGRRRIGFLITHAGLLVLLAGAIITYEYGIEGQVGFVEGETADSMTLHDRSLLRATRREPGSEGSVATEFLFQPGPVDWPAGKTLALGQMSGIGVEILKFYRHARVEEDWVEATSGRGSPALKFELAGLDGRPIREEWLVADQFGGQMFIGPLKFEFQRLPTESMLEDFLNPPANMDQEGVLSMHYAGRMERVPVSKSLGKKIPFGDGKLLVEIVEYLPNAAPGTAGKFVSRGDEPANPLLELRVTTAGNDRPIRQIAFAKFPFLNFDGVHGQDCPVKFVYHHPAMTPDFGVEFFQAPDGKIHCRVGQNGKYESRGVVAVRQPIDLAGQFKVSIADVLSHARREVSFYPLELGPGEQRTAEPAVLVRFSTGGKTEEIWLQRNHPEFGQTQIQTQQGPIEIRFGNESLPLGFSLQLIRFQRGLNPGSMGDASFSSRVRLIDSRQRIDEERVISMNEPLTHGRYTFYQSSFQELGDGKSASILSVAYDPGRFLKYFGSLMICVGIAVMFYVRYLGFGGPTAWRNGRGRAEAGPAAPGELHGPATPASNGRKGRNPTGVDMAGTG